MRDPDDTVRESVVGSLLQLGPDAKAAIGVLIIASQKDSEALVRQSSLKALESIGRANQVSVDGLMKNMKAPESVIRRNTVAALIQSDIPPAELTPLLAVAVKDSDTAVKLPAVQAVGELAKTYAGAVSVLRTAAFTNDKKVRPVAIHALGGAVSSPDAAVLVLDDVLKDADPAVRNAAIESLARLGPPGVPALLRETHDSYTVLGETAAAAIVAMGSEAIPALEAMKRDPDAILQKRAAELIGLIQNTPKSRR
jgi:HEAT repeat protein